ncbi:glutathione S-transferase [Methylococcus capsulatus]|uniref:glutathione S-transferase n=1 Tax=Methylococcus capsulatus TaxID=414 RepID=UPI00211B2363|nr:glutathione S-transferase [Methylococcus capsulatus]
MFLSRPFFIVIRHASLPIGNSIPAMAGKPGCGNLAGPPWLPSAYNRRSIHDREVPPMITLYGSAISNYYNKVKLALLEKGIEFREERTIPSQEPAILAKSPLGKIPFIETDRGCLSESQAILEYLEDAHPEKPLYPADPYARAKCRELIQHLELNVELIARRLYPEAFFGGEVSEETKAEVRPKIEAGLKGVMRLARFRPYVCSEDFGAADCAAWPHLTLIGLATSRVYGEDLVSAQVPALAEYLAVVAARPAAQKVAADRAEALETFFGTSKP